MSKKLINEDIKNMKYLFGYKPGRVISEQDIDYTTDEYLDIDNNELDEDFFDGWDYEEQDMDTGEELYPSFDSDKKFIGMTKPMGDMETDDEDTLFEQDEPETDRYMFFNNLQQMILDYFINPRILIWKEELVRFIGITKLSLIETIRWK